MDLPFWDSFFYYNPRFNMSNFCLQNELNTSTKAWTTKNRTSGKNTDAKKCHVAFDLFVRLHRTKCESKKFNVGFQKPFKIVQVLKSLPLFKGHLKYPWRRWVLFVTSLLRWLPEARKLYINFEFWYYAVNRKMY